MDMEEKALLINLLSLKKKNNLGFTSEATQSVYDKNVLFPLIPGWIPSFNLAQIAPELVGSLSDHKLSKWENIHTVGTWMIGGEERRLWAVQGCFPLLQKISCLSPF